MREKPGVGGEEPGADTEPRKKRLDLSVPQVAGSAVAAVVAAKLASYFGVYGTILGAGLVSVVATSGERSSSISSGAPGSRYAR